jgi:hypothetical protein
MPLVDFELGGQYYYYKSCNLSFVRVVHDATRNQ